MKHFLLFILSILFTVFMLSGCKKIYDFLVYTEVFHFGTAYINGIKYEATDTLKKPFGAMPNTELYHYDNEKAELSLSFGTFNHSYMISFYFIPDTMAKKPLRGFKYPAICKKGLNDWGDGYRTDFKNYIDSLHTTHPDSSFCIAILHPGYTDAAFPLEGYVNIEDITTKRCRANFALKTNYESPEKYTINGTFDVPYNTSGLKINK